MNEFNLRAPKVIRPVIWKYAALAGLIAGAVFFVVSRGIPWSSGIMTPTVVGRELQNPATVDTSTVLVAAILHFLFSIGYALIVSPIVNRFRAIPALLVGGILGLGLYFINAFLFSHYFTNAPETRESIAVVTHVAFGMVAAGAYKGLARPRVDVPDDQLPASEQRA